MNAYATNGGISSPSSNRERVSLLLARYPAISDNERQEILSFMQTARHLDVGLLTSNDNLRPKLDAFMEAHKAHFRVRWSEGAALVAGIVALLALAWLVFEAFAS